MDTQDRPARVKARVTMSAVKIHGPNSPDVLSGRVPIGFRDDCIQFDRPEQIVELTYEQVVEMFGLDTADDLFKGVKTNGS